MKQHHYVMLAHVEAGWFLSVAVDAVYQGRAGTAFAGATLFFIAMIVGHWLSKRRHPSQAAERAA